MDSFAHARDVQNERIDELAQQARDRYGIKNADNGQRPAVSKVLLFEQLLINAGLEV